MRLDKSVVADLASASVQGGDLDRPVEIWGEDALLQWPGARRPVIQERDAYMARTIWAAATGGQPTDFAAPMLKAVRCWYVDVSQQHALGACTPTHPRQG